jgi:hypothetical protein
MTKFATLLAAVAAATLAGAATAQASPYRHGHLVQSIVQNQIEQGFDHREPNARVIRAAYLAGFSYWYDSRCDFLPMPTFEAIRRIVDNASREAEVEGTAEAVRIGLADAKAFLGEQGCATRDANAARASLTAFWQTTAQIIQNGQRQRRAPETAPTLPQRREFRAGWSDDRNRM